MAQIFVSEEEGSFHVKVKERNETSEHIVHLDNKTYNQICNKQCTKEELIKASFHFLLDREPKEAIQQEFTLSVIGKYFPEYTTTIKEYIP